MVRWRCYRPRERIASVVCVHVNLPTPGLELTTARICCADRSGNENSGSTSVRRTREGSFNRERSAPGICFDNPEVSASMIVESS